MQCKAVDIFSSLFLRFWQLFSIFLKNWKMNFVEEIVSYLMPKSVCKNMKWIRVNWQFKRDLLTMQCQFMPPIEICKWGFGILQIFSKILNVIFIIFGKEKREFRYIYDAIKTFTCSRFGLVRQRGNTAFIPKRAGRVWLDGGGHVIAPNQLVHRPLR